MPVPLEDVLLEDALLDQVLLADVPLDEALLEDAPADALLDEIPGDVRDVPLEAPVPVPDILEPVCLVP